MIIELGDWSLVQNGNEYVKLFTKEQYNNVEDPIIQVYQGGDNGEWYLSMVDVAILNNGIIAITSNIPFRAKVVVK